MSTRKILPPENIHPAALAKMTERHADVVSEVDAAVRKHAVVVVGMAQNPHVRNVRKMLGEAGIAFEYLEYGSYLSQWGKRLALKQWSGWPTFPQVFVRGVLIGGEDLTRAALEDGTLRSRLESPLGVTATA